MPVVAQIHRSNSAVSVLSYPSTDVPFILPKYIIGSQLRRICSVVFPVWYCRLVVVNIIGIMVSFTNHGVSRNFQSSTEPEFWIRHIRRYSCEPSFTDITVYRPIPVPILYIITSIPVPDFNTPNSTVIILNTYIISYNNMRPLHTTSGRGNRGKSVFEKF